MCPSSRTRGVAEGGIGTTPLLFRHGCCPPPAGDDDPTSAEPPEDDPVTVTLYDADFSISVAGDLTDSVFKVGDPDQTLSIGEHVAQLEYGVADVLKREGGASRFDWYVVGDDWELDIAAADLTVRLPSAASRADCVVGDEEPCDVSGVGTTTLVITTGALEQHTPVLLRALVTGP